MLAFPDKRAALDVVHPQVHNHAGSALIDDPDVDYLTVLAEAIENPAASGRDALNVGAAARPLLMPGSLAGEPRSDTGREAAGALGECRGWRRCSARDVRPAPAAAVVWPRTSCKLWQRILPERGRDFGLNAWILRLETRLANAVQSACPDLGWAEPLRVMG